MEETVIKKQMQVRIGSDLHRRLKVEASKRGCAVGDLANLAIRLWLKDRRKKGDTDNGPY